MANRDRARRLMADGGLAAHLYREDGDIDADLEVQQGNAFGLGLLGLHGPLASSDASGDDGPFALRSTELFTVASAGGRGNFRTQTLRVLNPGEFVLTFDDGPCAAGRTALVLDALREYRMHATFFQLGSSIASSPAARAIQKRILDEGHDVGVHGWHHATPDGRPFPVMSSADIRRDLIRATDLLTRTYGFRPVTFRAPYGEFRSSDLPILSDLRLKYLGWDIDTNDWRPSTVDKFVKETTTQIDKRGSGIILMHDVQQLTALSIRQILQHIRSKGYRVVNLRRRLSDVS